jgi:hypothetical protein
VTYRKVSYLVAPVAAFAAKSVIDLLLMAVLVVGVALYLDYRDGNLEKR